MKTSKVLLVNPSWREITYLKTNIKVATLSHPILSLPTIAAPLVDAGHNVKIFDMDIHDTPRERLKEIIRHFNPEYVGITGTTPFAHEMVSISKIVKEINRAIVVVVGGVHATTIPDDFLKEDTVDIVVIGEGDFTLRDIVDTDDLHKVKGIMFKVAHNTIFTGPRPLVDNLDELPFPAWDLVEHKERYANSYILSKKNPVGPMETSRGCPWHCCYCNKTIFKHRFRPKSVTRVVDEMVYMLQSGFNEIHVQDDNFSTDMDRAKQICDEIIRRGVAFPWMLMNGIRVNCVDLELFEKLKMAGCYLVGFGIESGNQEVLDDVNKGITLEMVRNAVTLARKVGVESYGFFMLGLPKDTEETMQQTIDFAKELNLDVAKFDITIPYPGTRLFDEWDRRGLIKSKNWRDYIHHQNEYKIYNHPHLNWDTLRKYYKKAFREYYIRPRYILMRFKRSIHHGEVLKDIKAFFQTQW